jgi:CDP-4-dehydro-6-deoxyglucose reductase
LLNCVYHVIDIVPLTHSISQLILKAASLSDEISYQAGQYIHVIHSDSTLSPLSIACAPNQLAQIELHLSHALTNTKAQDILAMAKNNKVLSLAGPYGSCVVSQFALERPLLFFVRGTGFAPAKALLEELFTLQHCPSLHLYWGAATQDDFYLLENIRQWEQQFPHFRFTSMVSRSADVQQLHDVVLMDHPDLSHCQIYASGAEKMIFSALTYFQQHGLDSDNFYSDFTPLSLP